MLVPAAIATRLRADAAVAVLICVCGALVGCAGAPPPPAPPPALAVDPPVVPLHAELVRAWNQGRAPGLRARLHEALSEAHVDVVEGGRGLRAGHDRPSLALVVRLSDLVACADPDSGVVGGEPPRVVGCGGQGLAGLALFASAIVALPGVRAALVVGEDDDDIDALTPPSVRQAWLAGGSFTRGPEVDVLDVVAVDPGWLELSLRVSSTEVERLVQAVARAVTWQPTPRLPTVVADRLAALPPSGPFSLWREDASDLARDPARRELVVDRCLFVELDPPVARVRCRGLPGRPLAAVRDDVLRAVDDPSIDVSVDGAVEASATGLSGSLPGTLLARMRAESPRFVVAPALALDPRPTACALLRRRGVGCVGAVPVLLHAVDRARAGRPDEEVPASALVAGGARVVDIVAAVASAEASSSPVFGADFERGIAVQ